MENSLGSANSDKLVDIIAEANVKLYYDVINMAHYVHRAEAVPGITLQGTDRICQVHVKNGDRLLEGDVPVDWSAALEDFTAIGYDGWYVLESRHRSREQLLEATRRNIDFLWDRL